MTKFQRQGQHPLEASAFELAAQMAMQNGKGMEEFLIGSDSATAIEAMLQRAKSPIRLHGKRVEEMFGHVAASLGRVLAVKREDAGTLLVDANERVAIPDYRLILADRSEILVEVKNCNATDPAKPLRLTESYLRALDSYAQLFDKPAYLAIYWSQWRIWSLLPVKELIGELKNGSIHLPLLRAVPCCHMYLLGDMSLGTVFPLVLRFSVDAERTATSGSESTYAMAIRSVDIFAKGVPLLEEREKNIAWGLMLYGQWAEQETVPIMEGEILKAVEFTFLPETEDDSQGFAIVASLSSLASARFNDQTTHDGRVTRIHVNSVHRPPYPILDDEYKSENLPLWRFTMKPRSLTDF